MKFRITDKYRWFFAILPHQCQMCDDIFWMERGIKYTDHYGDSYPYCDKCAPFVWRGALQALKDRKKGE